MGDSRDRAAPTPRAVGRPVGSKEPEEEAGRRVWGCGLRGGQEKTGRGGEIPAWPGPPAEAVCVRGCAGQPAPGGGRALGGSEGGCKGSRVGDPKGGGGRANERARSRASRPAGSSVCVSGPVAQDWSRLAPTGMRLLPAAQAAPCSTRRWPPGKGGRGAEICLAQHEPQTKANLSDLLQPGQQTRGLLGFGGVGVGGF